MAVLVAGKYPLICCWGPRLARGVLHEAIRHAAQENYENPVLLLFGGANHAEFAAHNRHLTS